MVGFYWEWPVLTFSVPHWFVLEVNKCLLGPVQMTRTFKEWKSHLLCQKPQCGEEMGWTAKAQAILWRYLICGHFEGKPLSLYLQNIVARWEMKSSNEECLTLVKEEEEWKIRLKHPFLLADLTECLPGVCSIHLEDTSLKTNACVGQE